MMSGTTHAVLLTGPPDEGPYNRALLWPDEGCDFAVLSLVAQTALQKKQPVINTRFDIVEKTGEPLDGLACPLFLNGKLFGVIAMQMTHRSQPMQKATVQQVQAGTKWLEAMILMQSSTAKEQLVNLVDLIAAALEHEQFKVAATEVTNELAQRFSCQRVSLGFLRYSRVRVEALSHSSGIDQQSNQVRAIRDAISESLDQGTTIVYPMESNATPVVTRFHARLAKAQQEAAICTVPLIKNGKVIGALLLERHANKPFSAQTVEQCEQIGLLLGPVLEARRRDERPLPLKIFDSLRSGCVKLFGPRHLTLKTAISLTVVLLVWISMTSAMFRISCDSVLEAEVCRAIVAPQKGFIAEAHVRAGDLVQEGDLLATLDDQDLRLEQRKWQSQRSQLLKEHRKALAGSDRAEVAILNSKRAQAEAQLSLVEQQLARATLVAPFSGLIVKGDLSQALGSPVTRGEVLYEVAPTDEYRVVLKIDDRDIGLISLGQQGRLKLSGIPDNSINITIDRLTPVSASEEGRNYFRVEAIMESHSDLMRPGMEGIAKIEIGREKLLWIWTRRLVDWLRLFVWNRMP
ncbi:MAG: HlyD family efflux transporter periplasmic adaptor subunit [Desulfuromusa sp.]|nr:HlyD family efflux transporter periplasmic adaptor subunit [Desulfuromusa sp.]